MRRTVPSLMQMCFAVEMAGVDVKAWYGLSDGRLPGSREKRNTSSTQTPRRAAHALVEEFFRQLQQRNVRGWRTMEETAHIHLYQCINRHIYCLPATSISIITTSSNASHTTTFLLHQILQFIFSNICNNGP
mmetsp:Transcript_6863/g.14882  ORF Transcript_6863/g.14882 Transcript_6863/m.14882 type:complete len:132 (+) Transcript_6863:102-497(+)